MKGVDTNVLVRFIVRDDVGQAALADQFLEASCHRDDPCLINRVVLCELVWVLDRGYRYARESVAEVVEKILRTEEFRVEDADQAWAALAAYRAGTAGFVDALIGEINRAWGCETTATLDRDAGRLDGFVLLDERPLPTR